MEYPILNFKLFIDIQFFASKKIVCISPKMGESFCDSLSNCQNNRINMLNRLELK